MKTAAFSLIFVALSATACSQAEKPDAAAATPEVAAAPDGPAAAPPQTDDPTLTAAVSSFLGDNAATTRPVVRTSGQGSGRIALIYLVGPNWCGTGGCNLLILRPGATGWEQVGNVGRVSNPVRILTTSTNGLPDIGVTVSGGGGPPAYEAKLSFDGRAYPRFPSDTPLTGAEGTVVITDADIPPLA